MKNVIFSFRNITANINKKNTLKLYSGLTNEASPSDRDFTYNQNAMEYTMLLNATNVRIDTFNTISTNRSVGTKNIVPNPKIEKCR